MRAPLTADQIYLNRKKIQRIFFYRICGTGMGNAAICLKQMGFEVEGGDSQFYPPMSDYLKRVGIPFRALNEVSDEELKSFDLIVVGNVVGKTSADATRILALEKDYSSFPATLGGLLLRDREVVGIAGTHGKTTTTYLLKQIFNLLGADVGYLVGGVIEGEMSAHIGGSDQLFFIEADEYDSAFFHKRSKFHYYELNHLLLTSLEFDHADIFNSVEDIEREFTQLLDAGGLSSVISNHDYPSVRKVMGRWQGSSVRFGHSSFKVLHEDSQGTDFELQRAPEAAVERYQTNLIGPQNLLNLSLALLFARNYWSVAQLQSVVGHLQMVKRRQEVKGRYRGAVVVDDFAHHPTAVRLTLQGLRTSFPNHKVVVFFAPISATARSSIFQNEFAQALVIADEVVVIQPDRASSVQGHGLMDSAQMAKDLQAKGRVALVMATLEALLTHIDQLADHRTPQVFVFLNNGSLLGLWESRFVHEIQPL